MKKIRIIFAIFLLCGCYNQTKPHTTNIPTETIHAIQSFTQQTSASIFNTENNESYAPISLYLILSMLECGAQQQTYEELHTFLQHDYDQATLANQMKQVFDNLSNHDIQTDQSIWLQKSYTISEPWNDMLTTQYNASLHMVDYSNIHETTKTMEQYIKKQTEYKLDPVIEIDDDYILTLLHTLTFDIEWKTAFKKDNNIKSTFYNLDQSQSIATFMDQTFFDIAYYECENYAVAGLPLKGQSTMYIFLPTKSYPLSKLVQHNWLEAISFANNNLTSVHVVLPKFEHTSSLDLIPSLQSLGIHQLFRDADLQIDSSSPYVVDQIQQNTYLKLNEIGVEAAVETHASIEKRSSSTEKFASDFILDHPFFYVIMDDQQIPILMGTRTSFQDISSP